MSEVALGVVVVGGGLAGLCSAVRVAELGCEVTVLEQGTGEAYPCNSRYSGGIYHLAYHDVSLPPDELVTILRKMCPPDIDFSVLEVVARNAKRALDWLVKNADARFIRAGASDWEKWCLAPPRPAQTGLVWLGRGPDVVLRRLREKLAASGNSLRVGARVIDIHREEGKFAIQFESDRRQETLQADAVVLADGGFQANLPLLKKFLSPKPESLHQRNAETGCGTGLEIGTKLGAETSALNTFYGHLLSQSAFNDPKLWPYPMLDGLATAGVVVGRDAGRFVDEGRGGVYIANELARRQDPLDAYIIIDEAIWNRVGKQHRIPANPLIANAPGAMLKANSIAELGQKTGIDANALARTIDDYNAAVKAADFSGLQSARTAAPLRPAPIEQKPFYAIPICAGITHTTGGLLVDTQARVRSRDGGVIEGLFAAGSTVGAVEGGADIFYTGGLCKAATLGLVSGETAAAYLSANGK